MSALHAVRRPRFLLGAWPWRSLVYLLTGLAVAGVVAGPLMILALPWAIFGALEQRLVRAGDMPGAGSAAWLAVLVLLGAGMLGVFGPLLALPVASLERLRLRLVDQRPLTPGHARPSAPGAWPWLRTRYAEQATWREVAYLLVLAVLAPALGTGLLLALALAAGLLAAPLIVLTTDDPVVIFVEIRTLPPALLAAAAGVLLLAGLAYLTAGLAGGYAALARALLGGGEQPLRTELVEVARSRARLVDAFEAERRRIERDLHDGAQQRLVSLTLQLGLARLDLPEGSAAAESVGRAHEQAKALMTELRGLIHGIHPRTLAELGLPAALAELAERAPVPVTVRAELPRLPAAAESTAYFVAAEALANVAKHAAATRVTVTAACEAADRAGARQPPAEPRLLVVEVVDDGRGGADPGRGTGLTGLADRVAAAGGTMYLSSPVGGPTVVRVELPCRSSRPGS
ncbi:sensor domain-containing protein [Plantactinospora siamensis]|uniref:histidine kinase n=1 Tax=Plantactinospora siamensis TaxID=555372 RepID=A0ABV6P1R4_9ACTN